MDVAPVADPPGADLPVLQCMRRRNAACDSAQPVGLKVMQAMAGREASRHLGPPAVDDVFLESWRGERCCDDTPRAHWGSGPASLCAGRKKPEARTIARNGNRAA